MPPALFEELMVCLKKSEVWKGLRQIEKIWDKIGEDAEKHSERRKNCIEAIMERLHEEVQDIAEHESEEVKLVSMIIEEDDEERTKLQLELNEEVTMVPIILKLFPKREWIRAELTRLRAEKEKRMQGFLDLIKKKEELETALGINKIEVDKDVIPSEQMKRDLQHLVEELVHEMELRETRIFGMTERITNLLGILGYGDLNASSISSFIDASINTVKTLDIKRVQQSLMDLENAYQVKVEEVEGMLDNITNIYEKLNVPEEDQLALTTGAVCSLEELLSGPNYQALLEENVRMNILKEKNYGILIKKAEKRLEKLKEENFQTGAEIDAFFNNLDTSSKEKYLEQVEKEIQRLEEFQFANKDFFDGVWELIQDSKLADDLFARMNDPNRLFKARGNQLFKEEEDRKKVNNLPRKCEKILLYGIHVTVFGEPLKDFVDRICEKVANMTVTKPVKKKTVVKGSSLVSSRSDTPSKSGTSRLLRSATSSNLRGAGYSTSSLSRPPRQASKPVAPQSSRSSLRSQRINFEIPQTVVTNPSPSNFAKSQMEGYIDFSSCCNSTEVNHSEVQIIKAGKQDFSVMETSTLIGGNLSTVDPTALVRTRGRSPSPGHRGLLARDRRELRRSKSCLDMRPSRIAIPIKRNVPEVSTTRRSTSRSGAGRAAPQSSDRRDRRDRRRSRTTQLPGRTTQGAGLRRTDSIVSRAGNSSKSSGKSIILR